MWGDGMAYSLGVVTTTTQTGLAGPGAEDPYAVVSTTVISSIADYANCTKNVDITTNRFDTPGKMTFTTVEDSGIGIEEGSRVEFRDAEGNLEFVGYVFTAKRSRDGTVEYTAYDQLRYLKAKASYTFENMTLGQIIQQIANDFGLTCGTLVDTGYIFPSLIKENETCLDIIFDALEKTIVETGKIFVFYDNVGSLTLVEAKDMYTEIKLGDGSLLTDYSYKRDIDSQTYNRVKLVRPNKESGRTDVYLHEDTDNIGKWGLLQYYSKVNDNLNDAQIDEMCAKYLEYYNRVLQTISIDAIGVPGIRAGMIVPVEIADVETLSYNRLLLAEKVSHKYEGEDHTMSIEVRSFDQLGGISIV